MVLDCHVHIRKTEPDTEGLKEAMAASGVDGGILFSVPPTRPGGKDAGAPASTKDRLDHLFAWCGGDGNLFPFYWIDPLREDATEQVAQAVERNVAGFKVICSYHYPGEGRALETYKAIADAGKPMLFHSGILWNGEPSAKFNRPAEFEVLMTVPSLRFALAHVSWPWHDECIAVFGKLRNKFRNNPEGACHMFIDTTPGTPPIYRREVLTKVFGVGYQLENSTMFGTDCNTNYSVEKAAGWLERDRGILDELGVSESDQEKVFSGNLRKFVGDWTP